MPIAFGQRDMRMLMDPLMRRFTAVLARKGLAADWQFGAMPGCTAAAPVFLAKRRLHRGQEENHVLAFDVSKAFDRAPHGALALLLRHMGDLEEVIRFFHTLSCGSLVRIVTAHGSTPSIRLHRGLRQGSAKAPCSTSSSWSASCGALAARLREMLAMLCRRWCKRIVTTSS